jgi:hypothetical protein
MKSLRLDYYSAEGFDGCKEESYNNYFDELNEYDTLEELYIHTDFIHNLPSNVLKFTKLKKLEIAGSRFWNLTMERVPVSVEKLIMTEHSNLSPRCIIGMNRLVNLKELWVDDVFDVWVHIATDTDCTCTDKYTSDEPIISMHHIPNLLVVIKQGWCGHWELEKGWQNKIAKIKVFQDIRFKTIEQKGQDIYLRMR